MSRLGCIALVAAAILLPAGYGLYGRWHDDRLEREIKLVGPAMDAKLAERILGAPTWTEKCGSSLLSFHDPPCARAMIYASSFAPVNQFYRVVFLDSHGKVMDAGWVGSP
jgi:hypothetical protein